MIRGEEKTIPTACTQSCSRPCVAYTAVIRLSFGAAVGVVQSPCFGYQRGLHGILAGLEKGVKQRLCLRSLHGVRDHSRAEGKGLSKLPAQRGFGGAALWAFIDKVEPVRSQGEAGLAWGQRSFTQLSRIVSPWYWLSETVIMPVGQAGSKISHVCLTDGTKPRSPDTQRGLRRSRVVVVVLVLRSLRSSSPASDTKCVPAPKSLLARFEPCFSFETLISDARLPLHARNS